MNKIEPSREEWMSDDQWECACMLADIVGGFHHIYHKIKPCAEGIQTNIHTMWSTFDFNTLTTAVILGHDRMIRVEIGPSSPSLFRLRLHKRHSREGSILQRHPTIETAIDKTRNAFDSRAKEKEQPQ